MHVTHELCGPPVAPYDGARNMERADRRPASPGSAARCWPLFVLAVPAAIAVWSGWIGIGEMTGFGNIRPLPGIWNGLHIDTAVTLPVGVEAYAVLALRAWLTSSLAVSCRTRRSARRSAIVSLLLGMAGQVAYHLLTQAHMVRAPWGVTTLVSCLPVLVLGMGTALAHMLRADAYARATRPASGQVLDSEDGPLRADQLPDPGQDRICRDPDTDGGTGAAVAPRLRLIEAQSTVQNLVESGQRISRRTLRSAGLRGSNADLGAIAKLIRFGLTVTGDGSSS